METALSNRQLEIILNKPFQKGKISREDMLFLLRLRHKDHVAALFKAARQLRRIYFEEKVFLYGFLYISTFCRNNCNFCYYRAHNSRPLRYRKDEDQVIEAARALAKSGVHLIDLTMGEDPNFFDDENYGFRPLIRLVERIKKSVHLPIMVSPGVITPVVLKTLSEAGASWFACYQETHNQMLFKALRPGQNFQERINIKYLAHQAGLLTEEGILVGVGESAEDIVHSIGMMAKLNADQVRAMNFVPQKGTPMAGHPPADPLRELLIIALLRLVFPDRLVPATLDVEGLDGLKRRLDAGANVVTSIVPPQQGLAGVAQSSLDIDEARRTTEKVIPILESCDLGVANMEEFREWLNIRHTTHRVALDHMIT